MENTVLDKLIFYSNIGYDITLTNIYGKDRIRMIKRYSYITKDSIDCEQIIDDFESLKDIDKLNYILNFMFELIQKKEEEFKSSRLSPH